MYILECCDGSLYTGITTDLDRRLREHNGSGRGARYTRSRRPVRLAAFDMLDSRSDAAREELRIKRLTRQQKLELIMSMREKLENHS